MQTYIITFGYNHKDKNGYSLANCYTMIDAQSEDEARKIAFLHLGKKWAFIYKSAEDAGVMKFNLTFVPFDTFRLKQL